MRQIKRNSGDRRYRCGSCNRCGCGVFLFSGGSKSESVLLSTDSKEGKYKDMYSLISSDAKKK